MVPRPPTWRPGGPAPWAGVPRAQRTGIGIDRVLDALVPLGQRGPVPEDIGSDRVFGPSFLVNESDAPAVRHVNAAVLAALFEEGGEARLVLTRRSSGMRTHRGEVSFPGGRLDEGEDPPAAALREAHEEVALDPSLVTMAGWMHPVLTMVSGSLIMPVLATLPARPHLVPNAGGGGARLRRLAGRAGRPRDLPRGALEHPGAHDPGQRRRLLRRLVLRGLGRAHLGGDGAHDPRAAQHRADGEERI